ncbi:hypothetical protein AB0J82_22600 [Asanoa sp. NPDC049518]|uniref:hypothetical protein n=1 Tax=unclassified Asanoa TaxID=2685164 RepID=UPI00343A535A
MLDAEEADLARVGVDQEVLDLADLLSVVVTNGAAAYGGVVEGADRWPCGRQFVSGGVGGPPAGPPLCGATQPGAFPLRSPDLDPPPVARAIVSKSAVREA